MALRSKITTVLAAAAVAGSLAAAVPASAEEVAMQSVRGTFSYTTPAYATASLGDVVLQFRSGTEADFECWSNPTHMQAFFKVSNESVYVPREAVALAHNMIPECSY